MEHYVSIFGLIVVIIGLLIEFIAVAGMVFDPIRRVLPMASSIQLQSTGCLTFYVGVVIVVTGQLLA